MAGLRPNIEVMDAGYHPNALASQDHWLVLFHRSGPPGSDATEGDIEKIEISTGVASIEVTHEQLTSLPGLVWMLSGIIGGLLLLILIWAVQYPMGRRFATAFVTNLRDGRSISMKADIEVCRHMKLAIRNAATAP